LQAAQSGRIPLEIIDRANERIKAMKEQFPVGEIDATQIRISEHIETADKAAHAGMVLVRADKSVFPLKPDMHTIGLIEFASYLDSGVVEAGGRTGLANLVNEAIPQIETLSLSVGNPKEDMLKKARTQSAEVDVLIMAKRNAQLRDDEL
jgi:beta-glucosidase-like glycosyl hydrolase